jgi:hypothetical protein
LKGNGQDEAYAPLEGAQHNQPPAQQSQPSATNKS